MRLGAREFRYRRGSGSEAPSAGWTSHLALTYFAIAIVALVAFVINELRAERRITRSNLPQFAG